MEQEKFARTLLLRLKGRTDQDNMERGRSTNRPVFPTHINLNLQALPGTYILLYSIMLGIGILLSADGFKHLILGSIRIISLDFV